MCAQSPRVPGGPQRQPIQRGLPDDLYDYADDPEQAPTRRRRQPAHAAFNVGMLLVVDDWPDHVPVTKAEVDAFERYFGDVLDCLFNPVKASQEKDCLPPLTSDVNNGS